MPGQSGAGSSGRGTRREAVGPAAATAAAAPARTTRRTVGVTSSTDTTENTSTGRASVPGGEAAPEGITSGQGSGGRKPGRPGRPRGNEVDRAGDRRTEVTLGSRWRPVDQRIRRGDPRRRERYVTSG